MNAIHSQIRKEFPEVEYIGGVGYCGPQWEAATARALELKNITHAIGDMVRILLPHATNKSGTMNAAGKVTRIFPDGQIEIRTQLHGYYTVQSSDALALKAVR